MTQTLSIALLNPSRTCGMGGGGQEQIVPPVTYLRITVKIHVRACSKNLISIMSMQYAFYPIKLSPFGKKKVRQNYRNFIRGELSPQALNHFFCYFASLFPRPSLGRQLM